MGSVLPPQPFPARRPALGPATEAGSGKLGMASFTQHRSFKHPLDFPGYYKFGNRAMVSVSYWFLAKEFKPYR